jgi:hypothetical protein
MKTLTTVKGVWYIGTWMLFCTFHTLNNDYLTAVFTTPIWYRTGKNVYNSRIPIFIFWRTSQDHKLSLLCLLHNNSIYHRCACLEQEVDKILVWSKKLKFVWYTEHLEAILCRHLALTLPHIFSFIVIIEKT